MILFKKYWFIILLSILFLELNSCSPNYILDKNGTPVKIFVKIDRNYDDLEKKHKINRDFLSGFIQKDIKREFRKESIKSIAVDNEKDKNKKNDHGYLLNIKMVKYHAKRSSGGWGPGVLVLEYNLLYGNEILIENKNIDTSSILGGTYCAQNLNETIVNDVSQKIKDLISPTN